MMSKIICKYIFTNNQLIKVYKNNKNRNRFIQNEFKRYNIDMMYKSNLNYNISFK